MGWENEKVGEFKLLENYEVLGQKIEKIKIVRKMMCWDN